MYNSAISLEVCLVQPKYAVSGVNNGVLFVQIECGSRNDQKGDCLFETRKVKRPPNNKRDRTEEVCSRRVQRHKRNGV